MEMGNSKIVMKDLNLYYGDFHALKGINMEIPANKVTAFIGPSGCGNHLLEDVKPDERSGG